VGEMTHHLKILEQHYWRVKEGTKTFEIRINDRAYQKGDEVYLMPYNGAKHLTGESFSNLHFLIGDVYPIPNGDDQWCVFSLLEKK
jgi:hypothetical protein